MTGFRPLFALAAFVAVLPLSAPAQNVVSAKSGLVDAANGEVYLNGQLLKLEFGQFPMIPVDGTLKTGEGRAEVLLTPGVFLRMGAASSLKVVSNRLSDTRIELLGGKHSVEVVNLENDNAVTLQMGQASVPLDKSGVYQFDADTGVIKVYEGKLEVAAGDSSMTLKKGHYLTLNDNTQVASFDPEVDDGLMRWTMSRSKYISMANMTAARTADGGYGGNGFTSGWMWNPYLGLMTYVPASGMFSSPFGWSFYSPRAVWQVYNPPAPMLWRNPAVGGGAPYGYDSTRGYSVSSGRMATAAPRTSMGSVAGSPAATSAPVSSGRSAGGSIGGGGAGGRR